MGIETFELPKKTLIAASPSTKVKTSQLKILAVDDTVDKSKRIVLPKHGKLELSAEGEKALKLYIKKHEGLLGRMVPPDEDPMKELSGIGRSRGRHNALKELKVLEAGEF